MPSKKEVCDKCSGTGSVPPSNPDVKYDLEEKHLVVCGCVKNADKNG